MEKPAKTTIHMIGNAHIDPVWLWKYSAGVNEALATCTTAMNLLDEFPDFIFTRADTWVHEQVEKFDPVLFDRIRRAVAEGRWEPAGGWYVQPDCNFPTENAFHAQMRIGSRYLKEKFNTRSTTGFNVDSFGHTAFLPRFLRNTGFDSYIFMRPMNGEHVLPAELFNWTSPDGFDVLTWRIQSGYNGQNIEALEKNIAASLKAEVPGIPHVLCFYGVGDHGGGPTRELIEWIMAKRDTFPSAKLQFSSPSRFFQAVRNCPGVGQLPAITEELQYHAIGCYSVLGSFKRKVRSVEMRVIEAEDCLRSFGGPDSISDDQNDSLWKPVLLNHFHDTIGGTCIPDAYDDAFEQIGASANSAEEIISSCCYNHLISTGDDKLQRIVLFNPTDKAFLGPVSHEPWLEWKSFSGTMIGPDGKVRPYQQCQQPALFSEKRQLTWIAEIPPGESVMYRLDPSEHRAASDDARLPQHWKHSAPTGNFLERLDTVSPSVMEGGIEIAVYRDSSDTWSHNITSYSEEKLGSFVATKREIEEDGPVRSTVRVEGQYGRSTIDAWFRIYKDHPAAELEMRISWNEEFSIAKLFIPFNSIAKREDGVPGGSLNRPLDGKEYPFRDWIKITGENANGSAAVITPDCYGVDVNNQMIRLSILRSPPFAWHYPFDLQDNYPYRITDQGEHILRFAFALDQSASELDALAKFMHSPPRMFDWTRGM